MTDQTDDARLENEEQEDVEGHGALSEPHLAPGLAHDEGDDDVEGHANLKGGALAEPHLAPGLAHDEDDDVEAHMKLRGKADA